MSNVFDYLTGKDYKINGVRVISRNVSRDRLRFSKSSRNYRNKDLELFLKIYYDRRD